MFVWYTQTCTHMHTRIIAQLNLILKIVFTYLIQHNLLVCTHCNLQWPRFQYHNTLLRKIKP